jgi:hypothetical protein
MMPIINIHPLPSEEKAESFRLSLKDADKFGLYCCHDGTSAMWSVIPKIALNLIFNAETALPVTERKWVGLIRGVRVEGDTVVISVKGGNDAARELCGSLIEEKNT